MKITWFGHSCFRIEHGKAVVLVDPFLKGNPTFEACKVPFERAIAGVTHVAITHGHDDHIGSAVEACSAGATLVANWEICNYLGGKGVRNWSPGNHGGEIDLGEVRVGFVNAWHSSSASGSGAPVYLGNPAGLVFTFKDGRSVLHMGDTGIHSDMALTQELYRPEIGIVPIGDRFTMGAKQAALACKRFFTFKAVFPCHYGTFPVLDQTADKFVAEMKGARVIVPKAGEGVEV
jgi:L-ascorbate metabolism protein UlaG (beta-lactamase superfamily)